MGTSSPTVSLIVAMALFMVSCIFAWSSWLRSFWRSASFFCRAAEFWATAALACSEAWVDCRARDLVSSISCSRAMSRLANASAAEPYSAALSVSPALVASSAISTACLVLPASFS